MVLAPRVKSATWVVELWDTLGTRAHIWHMLERTLVHT